MSAYFAKIAINVHNARAVDLFLGRIQIHVKEIC